LAALAQAGLLATSRALGEQQSPAGAAVAASTTQYALTEGTVLRLLELAGGASAGAIDLPGAASLPWQASLMQLMLGSGGEPAEGRLSRAVHTLLAEAASQPTRAVAPTQPGAAPASPLGSAAALSRGAGAMELDGDATSARLALPADVSSISAAGAAPAPAGASVPAPAGAVAPASERLPDIAGFVLPMRFGKPWKQRTAPV
jgi:hypothetical protein